MAEPKTNLELKKHVAIVHCAGVHSLLERKISNVLLLQAYDALLTEPEHGIPYAALCSTVGFNSKDIALVKKALRSLVTTQIEFNVLSDGSKEPWTITTLMSEARIEKGMVYYAYSRSLAERLYDPEVYLKINLSVQRNFSSSRALNLYENCLRFKNVRQTGWWSLSKFRKLMGAENSSFDQFRILNERLIKGPVDEINKFSDILLVPEYERGPGIGRPVTAIRFRIQEHPQLALFKIEKSDTYNAWRENDTYKRLRQIGLSDRFSLECVITDEKNANAIAADVEKKVETGKIKKSSAAYARHLFNVKAHVGPAPIEVRAKERITADAKKKSDEADRGRIQAAYFRARLKKAESLMSPERRKQLAAEWAGEMKIKKPEALRNFNPATGMVSGFASLSLDAFLIEKALGPDAADSMDSWVKVIGPIAARAAK